MGIGKNILIGKRLLFGKSENNDTPVNLDIIQFNSASQEWELVSGIIGNAVQTSSNVGTGEGVAKARVGDDLPFRSLTTTSKISLTGSADEIEIDIGTLLISDVTGLQTALDSKDPPFLISDITGLQTALDSKIETLTNVGLGSEIAKAKVGQNVDIRKIKAGTGITVNQLTDEIEIVNSQPPPILPTKSKFVMGYHSDKNWKTGFTYGAMFTNKSDESVEAEAQGFFNFAFTVVEITVFVSNNIDILGGTIQLKKNSVNIASTKITIPALTTGKFSVSISEAFASGDEIHEEHECLTTDNDIKNTSYYLECESDLI